MKMNQFSLFAKVRRETFQIFLHVFPDNGGKTGQCSDPLKHSENPIPCLGSACSASETFFLGIFLHTVLLSKIVF